MNKTTADLRQKLGNKGCNFLWKLGIKRPGRHGWNEDTYKQIVEIIEENINIPSFRIGADPEFEVKNDTTGKTVSASRFFHSLSAPLGTDGYSFIGELRPKPGAPETVLFNIKKLLQKARNKLPDNYSIAGGSGQVAAIGGHLHIGQGREHTSSQPSSVLLDALDTFIYRPLNNVSDTKRRGDYNRPGSWRSQPHGWEYRSPCSWIVHPKIARGVLSISYTLAKLSDEKLKSLTDNTSLYEIMGIRAKDAKEFYIFLSELSRENKTLEKIDVFRAWEITKKERRARRPRSSARSSPRRQNPRLYSVEVNEDEFMLDWRGLFHSSRQGLTLVGARRSRTNDYVVFLPTFIIAALNSSSLRNITIWALGGNEHLSFEEWGEERSMGLSYSLRERAHGDVEFRTGIVSSLRDILQVRVNNV